MSSNISARDADTLRNEVATEYAQRVQGITCRASVPKEGAAKYREGDLADLPPDAVESSLGCGNPLAFSGVKKGDTVVDLGSGAGIDLLLAAAKTGPEGHIIGIDMTDVMIAKARANVAKSGHSNVEVRKGIIENLPVDTASVDWVISNCVVNLSPEKDKVFGEIARVLKPGGQMLISDIGVEDGPTWVRATVGFYNKTVAGAIGETEYLAALSRAGLVDVEVRNRIVYDESVIRTMLASQFDALASASSCGCGASTALAGLKAGAVGGLVGRVAKAVAGKVVSIQISARRA